MLIAEFIYNNIKNSRINYIFFKLNYNFYSCIFYKKDINLFSRSKAINKLTTKVKKSMIIY